MKPNIQQILTFFSPAQATIPSASAKQLVQLQRGGSELIPSGVFRLQACVWFATRETLPTATQKTLPNAYSSFKVTISQCNTPILFPSHDTIRRAVLVTFLHFGGTMEQRSTLRFHVTVVELLERRGVLIYRCMASSNFIHFIIPP